MSAPTKKAPQRRGRVKPKAAAPPEALPTATGTSPGNIDGLAIAITVFSTMKWWGDVWLKGVFLMPKLLPHRSITLKQLSFIHFARWSVVTELADPDDPEKKRKLNHAHLYFESNFNGGWEEYIDAFSHVLTSKMTQLWGSSYGFPGPQPTEPFKQYIKHSEQRLEASHFYSAYPESTVTMISQSLKLDDQLQGLKAIAADLSPEEFQAAFQ
ncbi:MAG: hypothetical protein JHD16_16835, partial [Solirubrobacteraceae bacterium]|nr:hypothetical protein [Solirubrobacteraceae bacterium]